MSLVLAFLHSLVCLGTGLGVLAFAGRYPRVAPDRPDLLLYMANAFLLGTILLSTALIALGLSGMLRPMPLLGLAMCGFAGLTVARREMAGIHAAIGAWLRHWCGEPLHVRSLATLVGIMIVGFGMAALVRPPFGDAEAFYMAYAKTIAASGRLEPMAGTYSYFSSIGLPAELHFAALMTLGDHHAAKLFVWPVALACAVFLAGIGRICGAQERGRLFVVVILFSSATFTHYISDGKVDLFAAAYGLAALYWLMEGSRKAIPIAGFFAGAATVAKFSYLPSLCPALAVLLLWGGHERSLAVTSAGMRGTAVRALHFTAWATLPWLPQLAKNAVFFGAPLAPFIGGSPDTNWLQQVWFSPETTLRIVLSYPLTLVFGRYPMQGGGLSLLMIAFAPLVFLLPKPVSLARSPLAAATLAAFAGTLAWVVLRPSVIAPRYILATLLLFVPIIAIAAERASTIPSARLLRAGIFATMFAALASATYHLAPIPRTLAAYFGGRMDTCALASPYCQPMRALNQVAKPGSRVFLAGYYGYWLREDLLQCRDVPTEQSALDGPEDIVAALRQMGFSFVVVDRSSHPKIYDQLSGKADVMTQSDGITVYALPDVVNACTEKAQGEWVPAARKGAE